MASAWPWLAIAGLGALHGLSPANGWMFAAARGVQARDDAQVRWALVPIAVGHLASVAIVAWAVAKGLSLDPSSAQALCGAMLVGLALWHLLPTAGARVPVAGKTGHAGLALWSFCMATAHGAGLMLVPVMVPLCLAGNPARELTASGSLLIALAAVSVHLAAMLATTGAVATGVCRGVARHPRLASDATARRAWTAALALSGAGLLVLR